MPRSKSDKMLDDFTKEDKNDFPFFNTVSDLLFILDEQKNILKYNNSVRDILKYSKQELQGKSIIKLYPQEKQKEVEQNIIDMLQSNKKSCLIPLIAKNNSYIPVETKAEKSIWNNQSVILIISKNLSDLKALDDRLKLLANNFKDIVSLHDAEGKYIYISPSIKHILGYTPEELIGTSPWQLVHPEDLIRLSKEYTNKTKGQGEDRLTTYRIQKKTGEYIWLETINRIIRDDARKIIKLVSTSRDITERKVTEEKLKESEIQYRSMIENSKDAIIIRQNEKITFTNKAFYTMLEYSKKEFLKINYKQIFSDSSLQKIEENTNNQETLSCFESTLYKKDGTKINVEINEKTIIFNNLKSQFTIIRDITTQKEIIKELQKGSKQTKGLNEYIPICAGCSKIRDDDKKDKPWIKPADYISERLPDIKFSHTMCPDCVKKWYPDLEIIKD